MATFEQNLQKIRGTAVYGSHVREAIAEALTQADDGVSTQIDALYTQINNHTFYISTEQIGATEDFTLRIQEGTTEP